MTRRLLFLALMTISSALYARCDFVPVQTSTKMLEVVNAHGGWPFSDEQCISVSELLGLRNLSIDLTGSATVFPGVSVGWASVTLIHNSRNVVSDVRRINTVINSPNSDAAGEALYRAIEISITGFDFAKAAQEIERYLTKR